MLFKNLFICRDVNFFYYTESMLIDIIKDSNYKLSFRRACKKALLENNYGQGLDGSTRPHKVVTLYRGCSIKEPIGAGRWYAENIEASKCYCNNDYEYKLLKITMVLDPNYEGEYRHSWTYKEKDDKWGIHEEPTSDKYYYIPPCARQILEYEEIEI